MNGFPIVLTGLAARRCVVIGGGAVATRKAAALVEAGARPVVIGPELTPELEGMAAAGQVEALRRPYRPGDLAGAALAIAATDDRAVNVAVSEEAQGRGIPVNVVDDPDLCTFIFPAVLRRGELVVAVSTGGGSPALGRHVREVLEATLDPAYGDLLAILAELRPWALRHVAPAEQPLLWQRMLDGELLGRVRAEGAEAARAWAARLVAGFGSAGDEPGSGAMPLR